MRSLLLAWGFMLVAATWAGAAEDAKFTLPEQPRVAFIGNTFVERDAEHGYFETRLILAFPDKDIVFSNLGWSGDTVRGEARAGFVQPIDGFNHLAKHVAELKPNLVFLNYGVNESWAGPSGLPAFDADLAKLLDSLTKGGGTQVVLFSIMAQEHVGPLLPNPDAHNNDIRLYNEALA